MAALDALLGAHDHVVAQVIETELGVRAVGDVGQVRGLLRLEAHAVLDKAHVHAQEAVYAPHPFRVALGQVVVHRHDVDVLALERVQVTGERGHERLSLAGVHLGDMAVVQGHAAHQLHVVMALPQHALRRLAHGRERLGQHAREVLAVFDALLVQARLCAKLVIAHGLELGLQRVDLRNDLRVFLYLLSFARRKQTGKESCHATPLCLQTGIPRLTLKQ